MSGNYWQRSTRRKLEKHEPPLRSRFQLQEDLAEERRKHEKALYTRVGALAQWAVTLITAIALIFTLRQNSAQLSNSQQQQITNRFTSAVAELGSGSIDVKVGGVYALARIMHDSPGDQSSIVQVISAFVRNEENPKANLPPTPTEYYERVRPDIASALITLEQRNTSKDGYVRADFTRVDFGRITWDWDVRHATFFDASFRDSLFVDEDLAKDSFVGTDFSLATISSMDFRNAKFYDAKLRSAAMSDSNFSNADLSLADLRDAKVAVDLSGAKLKDAQLEGADLSSAKGVTCAQIREAHTDNKTKLPPSLEKCSGGITSAQGSS